MDEPRQDEQHWLSYLDDNRLLAGLGAAYGVFLAALLGKLPLGPDEVLRLIVMGGGNHASAPLGYSAVWIRLPSALISLLCCLALVLLVRLLKMRWAAVVLAVFMILPIQLRYALEASPCSPAQFLREAAGGGYWVLLPLLAAVGFGLASRRMSRSTKALLWSMTVLSVLGSLAMRQMIFMLPAIVLLAVEGLRFLYDWRRAAGAALLSAIIVAAYVNDVKWFSLPRENYQLAAAAIKNTAAPDGCVLYFPSDASRLYLFFQPELASRVCDARQPLAPGRQFVLAISPAAAMSEIKPLFARMRKELMIPLQRRAVGGTSITLYQSLPAQPNR